MGPLDGIRVVEIEGLGPGPLAGMILADLGAEVVVVSRAANAQLADLTSPGLDPMGRGKQSIAVDLKQADGVDALLRVVDAADALIDPFRPGVAERLGFGPEKCLARNPKLVFGRMTGWGQDGPLAERAGHDINYISIAGVLAHIGLEGQRPTPPLNLAGDFGGGSMFLVSGMLAALLHVARGGDGQVVDAAMVDGAAVLMAPLFTALATGFWSEERGTNLLDSGAPYYDTYECADGRYISVGAIEPQFYAELLDGLGVDPATLPDQNDTAQWPRLRAALTSAIRTKPRDEWAAIFAERDACVAPVLTMAEAPEHEHNRSRGAFGERAGMPEPLPAPRFSLTPNDRPGPSFRPGEHSEAVLASAGFSAGEIDDLIEAGVVVQAR